MADISGMHRQTLAGPHRLSIALPVAVPAATITALVMKIPRRDIRI
jgi:hypothetical protein